MVAVIKNIFQVLAGIVFAILYTFLSSMFIYKIGITILFVFFKNTGGYGKTSPHAIIAAIMFFCIAGLFTWFIYAKTTFRKFAIAFMVLSGSLGVFFIFLSTELMLKG